MVSNTEQKVIHFTPTEQRMLDVLADGLPHSKQQLHDCLPDQYGDYSNIHMHISNIRKKLVGQDVLCVARQNTHFYQQVRLISTAD